MALKPSAITPMGMSARTASCTLNSTGVLCIREYPSGAAKSSDALITSSISLWLILLLLPLKLISPLCKTSLVKGAGTPTEISLTLCLASASAAPRASTIASESSCSSLNAPLL